MLTIKIRCHRENYAVRKWYRCVIASLAAVSGVISYAQIGSAPEMADLWEAGTGILEIVSSPDRNVFLLTHFDGKKGALFLLDPTTRKTKTLSKENCLLYHPTLITQNEIAFCTRIGKSDNGLLRVIKNAAPVNLPIEESKEGYYQFPLFDSGGQKLFAIRNKGNISSIVEIDTQSGQLTVLVEKQGASFGFPLHYTENELLFWTATWNGNSSPVATARWHNWVPAILNTQTGAVSPIPYKGKEEYNLSGTSISTNMNILLSWYESVNLGNNCRLYLLNDAGTRKTLKDFCATYSFRYTNGKLSSRTVCDPNFGSSGKSIVLAMPSTQGDDPSSATTEIHIVDLSNGADRQVTRLGWNIRDPMPLPNESGLLFRAKKIPDSETPFRLYTIDINGSNVQEIQVRVALDDEK